MSGNMSNHHIEHQKSIQNFITNVKSIPTNNNNTQSQQFANSNAPSTRDIQQILEKPELERIPAQKLSKYQERKLSGSQSRIPLYRGNSSDGKESQGSFRGRDSSLSNYRQYTGKIPRMVSNEKLPQHIENDEAQTKRDTTLRKSMNSKINTRLGINPDQKNFKKTTIKNHEILNQIQKPGLKPRES